MLWNAQLLTLFCCPLAFSHPSCSFPPPTGFPASCNISWFLIIFCISLEGSWKLLKISPGQLEDHMGSYVKPSLCLNLSYYCCHSIWLPNVGMSTLTYTPYQILDKKPAYAPFAYRFHVSAWIFLSQVGSRKKTPHQSLNTLAFPTSLQAPSCEAEHFIYDISSLTSSLWTSVQTQCSVLQAWCLKLKPKCWRAKISFVSNRQNHGFFYGYFLYYEFNVRIFKSQN